MEFSIRVILCAVISVSVLQKERMFTAQLFFSHTKHDLDQPLQSVRLTSGWIMKPSEHISS